MQISNNAGAALNGLNKASSAQQTQMERLASGKRINSAKDDAAGLSISTKLDAQSRSLAVALKNTMDGISRAQVEDGALSATTDDFQRIRELQLQQNNGILSQDDKDALQSEIDQRFTAIEERLEQTQFNGKQVFTNEDLVFQTGANAGETTTLEGKDLGQEFSEIGLPTEQATDQQTEQISQQPEAQGLTLQQIDDALQAVAQRRSDLGAVSNRLESQAQFTELKNENNQQANSRIRDTDFAAAVSEKNKADIQRQASTSIQAQANQNQKNVLQLLK